MSCSWNYYWRQVPGTGIFCNFAINSVFFDVLAYLIKWYLEKEEADKINRRIAEHRKRCTRK